MCRKILLIFLLVSACNIALAEKVTVTPEPAWLYKTELVNTKAPSPGAISSGYYMELADHQVNLATQTDYRHNIKNIVNETGVQNSSEVSVSFSPAFQKVFFHKVTLWRNGNIISELNASQIKVVQEETDAEEFQYNGLKRAFVILKGVQKNDRIEYAYSVIGFNPVFENHFSDKIYFVNTTAILNYFETYIVPAGRKLNIKSYNNAAAPAETQKDNQTIYRWINPAVKTQESQPGVPGWFDNYPRISISEFTSWQDVSAWGLKLFNNYQYPLTPELKNKIKEWELAAKGDKEFYTNQAIRFVQDQVRYLGLEIGTYTHQPHAPALIYRQRYGDCKDKALLLATLLQQEKIPAYVALVNTVTRSKLTDEIPSAKEFDHAIVAIERSNGYIYADATDSYQRGEPVNIFIPNYGYALLLRDGQTQLQPIEPGAFYNTSIEEKMDIPFADSCRLKVSTLYIGGAADAARSDVAETSTKDLEENYRQYYNKTYEGIQMTDPLVVEDDSAKNQLTINENYSIPSLWHVNDKGKKTVEVFTKAMYEQVPDPGNAYKGAPVAIPFPRTLRYVLELHMPEDWPFNIEELHIKNDSYQFDFTPEVEGNIIRLRYYYKTFKDNIPANEVAQYKTDYKKIEADFDFNLYYTDGNTGPIDNKNNNIHEAAGNSPINWLMVLLSFIFGTATVLMARQLNKNSAPVFYTAETGWPLGGWVIVLGITLVLSSLVQLYFIIDTKYFSEASWKAIEDNGGQKIQFIFVTEMVFAIFWFISSIALLNWFLKRRDIFPRMFIGYVGTLLTGQLILLTLYNAFPAPASYGNLQTPALMQIVRTGIYGAIWVSYITRSQRVKYTFVQPFGL